MGDNESELEKALKKLKAETNEMKKELESTLFSMTKEKKEFLAYFDFKASSGSYSYKLSTR